MDEKMTCKLSADTCVVLENILGEKVDNFLVDIHEGNKKGAGYLGSLCFLSLKNKETSDDTHLVLKQIPSSNGPKSLEFNTTVFHNELYFYQRIWPCLEEFQQVSSRIVFDKIPECYAVDSTRGCEKIVLENLNFQHFHVLDKTQTLDKHHLAYVFRTFGQFHGLTFAYRVQNPRAFQELTDPLKNIFDYFLNGTVFFKNSMKRCFSFIWDNLDRDILDLYSSRLSKYVQDGPELFEDLMRYEGQNEVLLHGDCWSNNLMFRNNDSGKVTDIRLIDFQMIRRGTPVFDLSYFFYSSASKEALAELEFYLKVYHESLSQSLATFGCASDEIYPFDVLQEEWKRYCRFGFVMAMICWEQKLRFDVAIRDLSKILDGDEREIQKPRLIDVEKYREITGNVVVHMGQNYFL